MSGILEERERGYEAKWAHDEETHFRIMSLRNARLAHWAATLMELPTDDLASYAEAVITAGVSDAKSDPVFQKIRGDLKSKGVDCTDLQIREKMKELYTHAEAELTRR